MKKTSETMIFAGLDIGKAEHAWALVDGSGRVVEEGTVPNRGGRLAALAKRLGKAHPGIVAGCEATGSYYERAAIAFSGAGVAVRVINPALTSTKALRSTMRATKTDRQDARGIAKKLQEKKGEIGTPFRWDPAERRMQALARHLRFLKKQRSALRVRATDMDSRPFGKLHVSTAIFDREIARIEGSLAEMVRENSPEQLAILLAIRGVGERGACLLLAETGCMKRFPTSKSFAAFAGLDPTLHESGTSVRGKSRMSKAGSPHLRASLTWGAKLLVQWNAAFRACFENALARGKAPGVAYGIVARKFATVAHQCVTKLQPFDPAKVGAGTVSA